MKSSRISRLAPLLLTPILAACSRGVPPRQVELAINMASAEKVVSTLAVPPTPAAKWAARAVMSGAELQCFAIAIAGPASENKNSCKTIHGNTISFTSLHGFHDKSASVEIETATGSGRKLFVIGTRMANGESCPQLTDFSPRRATQLRILGEASLDVANQDARIRVPVNFDGEVIDDCEGPALPEERKSIARCNLHRARVAANPSAFLSNQIVVHFPREMPPISTNAEMSNIIPGMIAITREWKHLDSYMLTMPTGLSLVERMDQLCALEHVSYVEPVEEIPMYSYSYEHSSMHSGPITRIALVDTGLSVGHSRYNGANFFLTTEIMNDADDDGDGFVDSQFGMNWRAGTPGPVDDENQGTRTTGAIAIGAGYDMSLAGNWEPSPFKIIGQKVLDALGNGNSYDIASAIEHSRMMGAGLIVMPLGGPHDNILLRRAMVRASASNILLVSAVASSGADEAVAPTYPASFPIATNMAVGSVSDAGVRSMFSNFGGRTKMFERGQHVITTARGDTMASFSGTTIAAARAAGLAARLSHVNPNLSAYDLRSYLESSYTTQGLRTLPEHQSEVNSAPQGLTPPLEFYPD